MPSRPSKRQKLVHETGSSSVNDKTIASPPDMDDIPFTAVVLTSNSRHGSNTRVQHNQFLNDAVKYTIAYDGKPNGMAIWEGMSSYSRCRLQPDHEGNNPFECKIGDIVYVKCDDGTAADYEEEDESLQAPISTWVAQILEIRAYDTCHVFLRVFWLNRPEDTPMGRQWYHSEDEVIPTTHMDIIDANTIEDKLNLGLRKIDEFADDEVLTQEFDLIWRQTFDVRTSKFSRLRRYCICKNFKHPNVPMLACDMPECEEWLHIDCIKDDALRRHYVLLGKAAGPGRGLTEKPGQTMSPLNFLKGKFGILQTTAPSEQPDWSSVDLSRVPVDEAKKIFAVDVENVGPSSSKKTSKKVKIQIMGADGKTIQESVRCLRCKTIIE